jgi:hypothetical protein
MQNIVQYRDLLPLGGRHKKDQLYNLLAILSVLKEVPWCGSNSFRATLGTNLHTSYKWDQSAFLESVVEAVVDIAETGVDNPDFKQHL